MMSGRIRQGRRAAGEGGFTLIELLVVIIILGILSAVVVFAVGGIGDKGQSSACKIDTRTLRTAEEAFYANDRVGAADYGSEAALVSGGFLSEESSYHNITLTAEDPATPGQEAAFTVTVQSNQCGVVGQPVNGTNNL